MGLSTFGAIESGRNAPDASRRRFGDGHSLDRLLVGVAKAVERESYIGDEEEPFRVELDCQKSRDPILVDHRSLWLSRAVSRRESYAAASAGDDVMTREKNADRLRLEHRHRSRRRHDAPEASALRRSNPGNAGRGRRQNAADGLRRRCKRLIF